MPRIIAGEFRGARLKSPPTTSTRPTADRVKESLFNIIAGRLDGATVLDLFAGTGNLGLESLSRGAASATFVDSATAPLIGDNAGRLRVNDRARVMRLDAFAALRKLADGGAAFDLIFADPPYHRDLAARTLAFVDARASLLTPDGLLILEHGADESLALGAPAHLALARRKIYGRTTAISFYGGRQP